MQNVSTPGRGRNFGLVVIGMLALALVAPLLFGAGLPRGHDLVLELVRTDEFARALSDGVLRPRWAANLNGGYGYPIFDFFPPVLLYLAGIPRALGVPLDVAVRFALVVIVGVGTLGSLWLGRVVGGRPGGWALAGAFVVAPYVAHDLYVRDAWSELTALCLAPGALAATLRVMRSPSRQSVGVAGVWLAGFAMSHNLSVLLFAPVFAGALVAAWGTRRGDASHGTVRSFLAVAASLIVGLLLAATYLVPIVALAQHVAIKLAPTGSFDVLNNLIPLDEIASGGWAPIFAFGALGVAAAVANGTRGNKADFVLGAVLALLVVLPTEVCRPVWEHISPLKILQFPWRLFSPATLVAAIAIARLAESVFATGVAPTRAKTAVFAGVALATAMLVHSTTSAWSLPRIDDPQIGAPERLRAQRITTTTLDEFVPRSVELFPDRPAVPLASWQDDSVAVEIGAHSTHSQFYRLAPTAAGELLIRTFYFPGWTVLIDGVPSPVRVTRRGTMAVTVPPGEHAVEVAMRRTPANLVGDAASGLGVLLVFVLIFARRGSRFGRLADRPTTAAV